MAFLTICLFFVAALGAHYNEPLNNKVQAHLMAMRPTASLNVKMLQDMATDCATAFHALENFTQNSSCATNLGLLWDNTTSANVSDSIIDAYCTPDAMNKSCADKLADLMTAALTQCQAVWASNFTAVKEEVRKFLYVAKVPCVRVNDRLCFKDFKRIASVTGEKFTKVGLDSICTQCTAVIFGVMAQFAPAEFLKIGAFLETACHQINGEYCVLKFQDFDDEQKSSPGGEPTAPQLDMICSPCVQTVLFRLAHLSALNNDTDSVANLTKGLAFSAMVCQKNFAGQYCFVQLSKYFNSTNNHLDDCNATILTPTSRATCPGSSCQTAIQNFRSSQGCCLGTWFNMLEMQYEFDDAEYDAPLSPKEMRGFAENSCKVNIPVGCAQAKIILAFVLAGIDPVWAAQNKQALEDAVKLALAYKLAIDVAAITLSATGTSPQSNGHHLLATNGGISFSATVETSTDTQTSRGLTNSASNLDLSVLSSQLPAAALSDPINGVQTQSAQITTVNNNGNGASLHSPATWIISLMALAALAIRA